MKSWKEIYRGKEGKTTWSREAVGRGEASRISFLGGGDSFDPRKRLYGGEEEEKGQGGGREREFH